MRKFIALILKTTTTTTTNISTQHQLRQQHKFKWQILHSKFLKWLSKLTALWCKTLFLLELYWFFLRLLLLWLINPNGCVFFFCNKTPDFTFFESFLIAHNSTFCDVEKATKKVLCLFLALFFYFLGTMSLSRIFSACVNDRIIESDFFLMLCISWKQVSQQQARNKKAAKKPKEKIEILKYIYRSLKSKSQCMEAWYWHWVD